MTITTLNFILIVVGAVIIAAGSVYYVLSLTRVGKAKYDALKEEARASQHELSLAEMQKQQLTDDLTASRHALEKGNQENHALNEQRIAAQEKLASLSESLSYERSVNEKQREEIEKNSNLIIELNERLAIQKTNLSNLEDKLLNQRRDFEELRKRSLDEFKVIANELLEDKSQRFARFNKENIEQILKPLGENLSDFRKQVKETYDKEAKERFSLEGRIKELVQLNNQISKEAQNLTNALKGQAKTQGDWGEMILENILEYSGLTKNREYFVQESFRDEEGNIKRPDVKVKYPDDRYIIIDSKVSLTAYERYMQAEDPDFQQVERTAHIRSVKTHIDELSAKEYDKFDKTLDFVMLFVPIEPAYLLAMQNDPGLWNYAYEKRILLISPTNLIAALKMVSDIWKRDDQNKNARAIAKRGEMLYEKFVGFVEDLEDIEKYISKADESWTGAMKKLKTGSGNLIGQAEKLRKLGLKPKKTLPGSLLPDQEEE